MSDRTETKRWKEPRPVAGEVVQLPDGEALVLGVLSDYDDGTELQYLTGPHAGSLTARDTPWVARLPRCPR